MPAYFNAKVAVGIVIGAGLAARFVKLETADRALPAGVLLGIAVCLLADASTQPWTPGTHRRSPCLIFGNGRRAARLVDQTTFHDAGMPRSRTKIGIALFRVEQPER